MTKDVGPIISQQEAAIADITNYIRSIFNHSGDLAKKIAEIFQGEAGEKRAAQLAARAAATRAWGTSASQNLDVHKGLDKVLNKWNNQNQSLKHSPNIAHDVKTDAKARKPGH